MQRKPPRRLPLDLPTPRIRYRNTEQGGSFGGDFNTKDKNASLFRKTLICGIIIFLVLIFKNIDSGFTQNAVGYIRDGITKDLNFDEALGKLKFVNNLFPESISTFGQRKDENVGSSNENSSNEDSSNEDLGPQVLEDIPKPFLSIPAEGKVVEGFSEGNGSILIKGTKNDKIYAVADGIISDLGDGVDGEKYIRIDHSQDIVSLYRGFSHVSVHIGDNVKKGQSIGAMGVAKSGEYYLEYETRIANKPYNPLELIESVN